MKAIIKEPGKPVEEIEIDNNLESLQEKVGGYIETYTFAEDACVICNEEGKLTGLEPNCFFLGELFVGTILWVGVDGDEFCDVPAGLFDVLTEQRRTMREWSN